MSLPDRTPPTATPGDRIPGELQARVNDPADPVAGDAAGREAIVRQHFDYVWRLLRRLGLPPCDADDAAQEVFLVGLRRWEQIQSGHERAFLYGCALNKVAQFRKRRAAATVAPEVELGDVSGLSPEDLLDRKQAQHTLDLLLNVLPEEQRTVFVLFEIEQLSTLEIATLLGIAHGTVASRLRLARARIQTEATRVQRSSEPPGSPVSGAINSGPISTDRGPDLPRRFSAAGGLPCTTRHD